MNLTTVLCVAAALTLSAGPGKAEVGRYSGEKLPRYAALKADLVYMRLGPGVDYAIKWELTRKHLPVRVVREYGSWRKVTMHDGEAGWIHRAMLTTNRYAAAKSKSTTLRVDPSSDAEAVATAAHAAPLLLHGCGLNWCQVEAAGFSGWAEKIELWGVDPEERFD